MAKDDDKDTLAQSWLRSLQNRPTVAVLLLVVIVISGLASFTDSIDKLFKFFVDKSNKLSVTKKDDQDARLEQTIVGTWILDGKLPTISGFVIKEFRTTYLSDGTYHIVGKYIYSDQNVTIENLPIAISGTWNIKDGEMHWRVESSNVPLIVKEGFSSVTKIISINNDK